MAVGYRVFLILPVLASLIGPARADVDVSAAVAQIQMLQGDIDAFNATAVQVVGPYVLNYQYTVVKTIVIDGRVQKNPFTYYCSTWISFTSTQQGLVGTVQAAPSGIAALQTATQALRTWNGLVPGTSARFDALVAQENQLRVSSQAGSVTDDQKLEFDASLSQTQISISASNDYMRDSSQSMVLFIQQSVDYQNIVSEAIKVAGASATQMLDSANNTIKGQGCPSGLGDDYNRIQGDIYGWIDRLNAAEAQSAGDSRVAQKSAADLSAFALGSQQNLASVQKELAAAGTQDYATFIQQLDLSVAQAQWNAIAAQAAK